MAPAVVKYTIPLLKWQLITGLGNEVLFHSVSETLLAYRVEKFLRFPL